MEFSGCRATIMGLGHFGGGTAAARWLARQGAVVTVTDLADEATLAESLAALEGVPIAALHLGGHREADFRAADLLVVNPAVRPGNRFLQIAVESAVLLTSEIELFLRACPGQIVGVTGSNGKSTTAAMTAAILRAAGRTTWLGGNIGASLLERLDEITPHDSVVLELSSFQLYHLAADAPLPRVAVVTGCTPNHLDWHGTYEDYVRAKQRVLTGQTPDDLAVLNTVDAEVAGWADLVRGRWAPPVPTGEIPVLPVPGQHNRVNAACAAAAARAIGCDEGAVRQGLASFCGLPQRLEWFAVVQRRRFYDDSAATTPESTCAALESIEGPVWLLAGGHDKGCDFRPLIAAIVERAQGVAFFGETGRRLRDEVAAASALPCTACRDLDEALRWCWERSRPGDAILLSPACPSGAQFRNFRRRGEEFVKLVRARDHQQNLLTKPGKLL